MCSTLASAAPRVTVVIPNWNGAAMLRACLISLRAQTYRDMAVLVVDNASSDDSVAMLRSEFPKVGLLQMESNRGYAGGCNAGFAHCASPLLAVLNNDIEAEPDWLAELVAALDRHPEASMAATRMMLYDHRELLNSAGDCYGRDGIPNSRGVWREFGPPYDDERMVFGASGGAPLYRRAMLDEIGTFEERFFMWCEDVDLNWRAQLAGFKCVYAPQAVVYHRLSATGGGKMSSFHVGRNTLWALARNMPPELRRKHRRAIWRAQTRVALDALRAWRGEAARARLRGVIEGLLTMGRWRAHNRQLMAARRVDLDYIESILE